MTKHGLDLREFYIHDTYPMYVQRWCAMGMKEPRPAAILVHGGAHTGVCWTNCPDGRPGWAQHLATRGWDAYIVDWPGVGRSPRPDDFLTAGPGPTVAALTALLREVGPALLIGHSIGAAISVKVLDQAPNLVSGFIAVAPAPPGIFQAPGPLAAEDRPIRFDEAAMRASFTNADRFPHQAIDAYRRTLCDLSPSIFNAVASSYDNHPLAVTTPSALASIRSLVIAGDQDQLVVEGVSRAVAEFLGAKHVSVGRDWGLHGFGHMMPVEIGSEDILDRALQQIK